MTTLRATLAEATALYGDAHPDTAIAHHLIGMAEISEGDFDAGIPELQRGTRNPSGRVPGQQLGRRRVAVGLGDALGASGKPGEAIPLLERAIAMLDAIHQ